MEMDGLRDAALVFLAAVLAAVALRALDGFISKIENTIVKK